MALVADVSPKTKANEQATTDTLDAGRGGATGPTNGVSGLVAKSLEEFVAALVEADGGELYVVSATADEVHLHLAGKCAGCPGATMTRERLLTPAVLGAAPKATVKVTTGWRVPQGAQRIH